MFATQVRRLSLIPFRIVPQQEEHIVERLGKFNRLLTPGLNIIIPLFENVVARQSLKETVVPVKAQTAITVDNVRVEISSVLYFRVLNSYRATYGVDDHVQAIVKLAQTTMRAELGKLPLDASLRDRDVLNYEIARQVNEASEAWGVFCTRHEISDINPDPEIIKAMQLQSSAEREKRAFILKSEGERQASINVAEGERNSVVLASEAQKLKTINLAEGEAQATLRRAQATALAIKEVSEAIKLNPDAAQKAMTLEIASNYVNAFSKLAKETNTMLLPSDTGNVAGMVAQAMGIYGNIKK